jgi:succinate dehydrogenase / fumarate reductase, membrane anchor subunit
MNKSTSSGVSHWLMQRITAVLLIPLTYPLIAFLSHYRSATYGQTLDWLQSPINLVYFAIWVFAVFYHAAMGLQVIIEDYVGNRPLQALLIKAVNGAMLVLGLLSLLMIYRIS